MVDKITRDDFAIEAMKILLDKALVHPISYARIDELFKNIGRDCYVVADAMQKARSYISPEDMRAEIETITKEMKANRQVNYEQFDEYINRIRRAAFIEQPPGEKS